MTKAGLRPADSLEGEHPVLLHFDGKKWSSVTDQLGKVNHAWRGVDGSYWATTAYSLLQMKEGATEMSVNNEVSAQRFSDIAVEPNGVFWLATSDGLFRYAPLAWRSPPGGRSPTSLVYDLVETSPGGSGSPLLTRCICFKIISGKFIPIRKKPALNPREVINCLL